MTLRCAWRIGSRTGKRVCLRTDPHRCELGRHLTSDRRPVAPSYHIDPPRPSWWLLRASGVALLIKGTVIAVLVWVVFALLALAGGAG